MIRASLPTAIALLLFYSAPGLADTICSPGMLRNAYGIIASGKTASGVACETVGLARFSNNSRIKVSFTRTCSDGSGGTLTGEGTFDVNANCSASAVVTFSSGAQGTYRISVVDGGNQFLFTASVPGIVFSGHGVKT